MGPIQLEEIQARVLRVVNEFSGSDGPGAPLWLLVNLGVADLSEAQLLGVLDGLFDMDLIAAPLPEFGYLRERVELTKMAQLLVNVRPGRA